MKFLFVCTGNTCRSPMAEAILKDRLKKLDIKDVEVDSCGINCLYGMPISENSKLALLEELGIEFDHQSRAICKSDFEEFDYIICMTKSHKNILDKCVKSDNVFAIDEIAHLGDILDPYGGDINIYKQTLHQLNSSIDSIINIIKQTK